MNGAEARDYEDLSTNPVFEAFNNWALEYQKLQREDDLSGALQFPDLRSKKTFYNKGYDLVVSRSKVLTKIIRGDPKKPSPWPLINMLSTQCLQNFNHILKIGCMIMSTLKLCMFAMTQGILRDSLKDTPFCQQGKGLEPGLLVSGKKCPLLKVDRFGESVWGLILRCPTSLIARKLHLLGKNFCFLRPTNPIQQRIRKEFFTSEIAKAERRQESFMVLLFHTLRLLPVLGSPNIMTGSMILTVSFPHGKRPTRVHLLRAED